MKLFLFSKDPGGANTIIPLVKPLEDKGYQIRLFGKGAAIGKYTRANLKFLNIMDFMQSVNLESVENLMRKERPDFIITGTSADDFTEKYIWKTAEHLAIPSFAIIDQWMNYGIRFSEYGLSRISEYQKDRSHPFLPSKILMIDEMSRQEAAREGLDLNRIEVVGHPHFETLLERKTNITEKETEKTRLHFGVNRDDFLITFASEPISADYDRGNSLPYWGFSEKTIFHELLGTIKKILTPSGRKVIVIIKLHPREDIHNYSATVEKCRDSNIKIEVSDNYDSLDLICASDLICGMSSMFLIESVILQKPVLSIQIGLTRENPFVLDRLGALKSIRDRDDLYTILKAAITMNRWPKCSFQFIHNPVERIINLMEMHLCLNSR